MNARASSRDSLADIFDHLLELSSNSERPPTFRDLTTAAGLDPSKHFVGASLREIDFRNEDLRGFNFSGADLSGADFRRANLTGVRFDGANLTGTIGLPASAGA